jgi:hypothetical protein
MDLTDVTFAAQPNYRSALEALPLIELATRKGVESGVLTVMNLDKAKEPYGARLQIAALGAVPKGKDAAGADAYRIVHDATHGVSVNRHIRVLDAVLGPDANDLKAMLRLRAGVGSAGCGYSVDIEDAHACVAVHPEDRSLLAYQVSDANEVVLHHRFAFGVSSAAYWWGRLGAAGVRLVHYVLGEELAAWVLLYADDWIVAPLHDAQKEPLLVAMWALTIFGFPIKWGKSSGGPILAWIGFEVNFADHELGISERRAAWATSWLEVTVTNGVVLIKELTEALGRLGFAVSALEYDKPFLSPPSTPSRRSTTSTPSSPCRSSCSSRCSGCCGGCGRGAPALVQWSG